MSVTHAIETANEVVVGSSMMDKGIRYQDAPVESAICCAGAALTSYTIEIRTGDQQLKFSGCR